MVFASSTNWDNHQKKIEEQKCASIHKAESHQPNPSIFHVDRNISKHKIYQTIFISNNTQ